MIPHVERGHPASLRHVSSRLTGPLPRRTRVLQELADDLEGLAGRFVADGMSPRDARRRAAEVVLPDGVTLERLDRLHQTAYRRLASRLDERGLRRLERGALATATLVVLAPAAVMVLRAGVLRDASLFLWPVLFTGALMLATCAWKALRLWIMGDHAAPRRGLGLVALASGLTVVLAVLGALVDVITLVATLERVPDQAFTLLVSALIREAKLVSVSLLFALVGSLFWILATQWIAHVEAAHERVLGAESVPSR